VRTVLIVLAVTAAVWLVAAAVLILLGRRVAGRELVALVPNLVRLFRDLLRDPRVPFGSKLVLGAAAVWIASPIDLLPEFLPVVGPLDDAIVAGIALRYLVRRAGVDVVRDHWRGDPRTIDLVLRLARARGPSPS
jgi:uncharacterized membrane protein YkvA (DUF1232 family)